MNIIQDFIPAGRKNRPGIKLIGPQYITIHDTANPNKGANALAHAKYLKTDAAASRPASWHFTVDDTRIVQHLPLDEVGWHAGDSRGPGNMSSIGIEICENSDGNRQKAEENAAWLVADLLKRFRLGIGAVVQHNRWSGKNCPHIIRARSGGWGDFLSKVESFMISPKKTSFSDVPAGHWAEEAIKTVSQAGIMNGYTNGTFGLGKPVTREELASVIRELLK